MAKREQQVSRLIEPDDWHRIRAAVLARDGSRCTSCAIAVASADADIHHLVPRAAGGLDDPAKPSRSATAATQRATPISKPHSPVG